MTDMMERLPTELMVEIMGCSDRPTIHLFTIVSSKYREIAQPLLFHRIYVKSMPYERLPLFVEQMKNSSKLALMIKILIIHKPYASRLLRQLFAVVSNLEELVINHAVERPVILLSPYSLPNLRRFHFEASWPEVFNYVVAKFISSHKFLDDLKVTFIPHTLNSEHATLHMPPLIESASSGVNRLVTYYGPSGLLSLLTPNSKMKHLTSSHQLGEGTLRKLSSAVSGRLHDLIVNDPMDPARSQTLPGPLIPSLFPNLRSIAWLSVDTNNVAVIDQLPHLRRIWFSSMYTLRFPAVVAFVSKIQVLSDSKNRPLQEIWVFARGGRPFSHKHSKASVNGPWVLEVDNPRGNFAG